MNERIKELALQAGFGTNEAIYSFGNYKVDNEYFFAEDFIEDELKKFAELIMQDMHKKVIASILITDVVMEEKGQVPTSEDYIRAINKDFGVEDATVNDVDRILQTVRTRGQ